jgi:phospholipid/cholesterol/gamma-HCH transport system substrate-binding protein
METNVNYTIVGAFVIALTACVILSIIWLSSGFSTDRFTTYKVYMTESVSGLSLDSPVEYNGVNVGEVKSIELNQKNPQLVELLLAIKSATPITQGTLATLNVKGLTGIAFVALQDKGTNTNPLVAQKDQDYPVIQTSPSFFLRLDAAITKLTGSLHQVSDSIRTLLDQENLRSIKETLLNIRQITQTLAGNSKQISSILHNTSEASKQFMPLMQSGNNAMQVFRTQTLPHANAAVADFSTIGNNLSIMSKELKENPSVLIRGNAPRPLGPGE